MVLFPVRKLDSILGRMVEEQQVSKQDKFPKKKYMGEAIKIRLSHELSEGEKQATEKREVKVLQCLKSLGIACDENNVPNIAILGSGGGLRAMIALLGTLVEMKNQGLLDAVMYLCGVSGSTWSMSLLYDDKDWTENVQELEKKLCDALVKDSWSWQEAYNITSQAADDELFSLTDTWAAFLVYQTLEQYDQTKLSQHQEASANGTNPYPIYAAVEKKKLNKDSENCPGTWFELTPHESGFPGPGAFVCTKGLGSKFDNGMLKEKKEEKNICYLQGVWGSALASMEKIIEYLLDLIFRRQRGKQEKAIFKSGGAHRIDGHTMFSFPPGTLCTCACCQCILLLLELLVQASSGKDSKEIFRELKEILKGESSKKAFQKCCEMSETWGSKTLEERMRACAELFEMEFGEMQTSPCTTLWKIFICICHWRWGSTNNFLYKCGDSKFTDLAKDQVIHLIDAGLAINSAYPLVLRPERKVKLILSFDFSSGNPFETIKKTATYCEENKIPFPKIDPAKLTEKDNPSDCYIFKGKDVPTVMHFPLFNKKNCPGEIEDFRNRFSTFSWSYPDDDVKELLRRAKMNVSNNKEVILEEIQQIVSSSTKEF
ncbi:cytosolic phospholipase A2 gamma-like [Emydura macquarii macquarii]|uniref:cytosolic phospholipase A2 gamma-like n=1 Tax=Emydura macquarii macquarii TaxID=1129001 RepID=UPI00352B4D38